MAESFFTHAPELAGRIAVAPNLSILLDYDGTLTPIVARPQDAHLEPRVREALQTLCGRVGVSVAIVSGRRLSDVRERVGLPQLIYAGNHGLEVSGPGFVFVEPTAMELRQALESVCEELTARLAGVTGAWVENKELTATVHFRSVPVEGLDQVRRIVQAVTDGLGNPFRLSTGQSVHEIRPRVNWNKGTATKWINEKLNRSASFSIYVGDDATDEDAFLALPDGITIRVGHPANTLARYHLPGPAEVERFLWWLQNVRR